MTSCQLFANDLEAFHDGELSREAAGAVRRHVAGCPGCAARLAWLAELAALLHERPEPALRPPLWAELGPRLGAIDATLPIGAPAVAPQRAPARPIAPPRRAAAPTPWRRFLPPLALAAGMAGVALLFLGRTPPAKALNVVRSLDTFGAPVLVMPEDAGGATVIWLLDEPGTAPADGDEDRHVPAP